MRKLAVKLFLLALLALAGFAALTLWRAAQREAAAEAAYPPEGQILQVEGRAVHAVVRGEGPDLVLIHGSSGSTRDFTFGLAEKLARDYRVIVFDRPGLGYSDPLPRGRHGIRAQAEHLARAAQQLGAEQPIVLGQSYGGAVALAWAAYLPDRLSAVVSLAGASHPWDTPLPRFYQVTSAPVLGRLVIPLITAWVHEDRVAQAVEEVFAPQSAPPGYAEHFGPGLTLRRASLRANALQRASLKREIRALAPLYPQIDVPLEIVHGTADTTVGLPIHSEKLLRDVPGAALDRLPGVGHMPHHVAQEAVIAAVHRAAARAGLR